MGLFFKDVGFLYMKAMEVPGLKAAGVMVAKAVMALWLGDEVVSWCYGFH